ncbi:MAG: cysteine desulfurase [Ruminococcaceae bacterium]|nr:cysteine desulfurase [Oscillospiraceae bacterium]
MKDIYLDNSATTPLSEGVKAKMIETMELYGNPSSLHPMGNAAHAVVEGARRQVGESLGLRRMEAGELIFTSCGSESDNLAILGAAFAKPRRRGMTVITTDSEHAGVENAMKHLEANGFRVVRIPTVGGVLDMERYTRALDRNVFLVSMMTVNNETGAMYDVGQAFAMAKAMNPEIVTHTDAVQGYLKCKLTPKAISADLITVSAHKIHGPKGVGALYISKEALKRRDIAPQLLGGGQEFGFRSGTENTVGIAGFGEAAREGYSAMNENIERMRNLRDYAAERLSQLPVRLNLPRGERAPHILNLTLPNIRSETMLHMLSSKGIHVSNGSACSSHSKAPRSSLTAFGLSAKEAEESIRVSFSHDNSREDVDALVAALGEALERLVRTVRR